MAGSCEHGNEPPRTAQLLASQEESFILILLFLLVHFIQHYSPLSLACASFFGFLKIVVPRPGGPDFDSDVSTLPRSPSYPLFMGHPSYGSSADTCLTWVTLPAGTPPPAEPPAPLGHTFLPSQFLVPPQCPPGRHEELRCVELDSLHYLN
jgi:hypothetical protein